MRGKLPTSDLNGHAHHAQHPHHAQHRKAGEDGEIEKLKAFVRHLQVDIAGIVIALFS